MSRPSSAQSNESTTTTSPVPVNKTGPNSTGNFILIYKNKAIASIMNFISGTVLERGVEPYPAGCVIVLAFIRALALYIVRAMQPLSLVDCPHFNAFVRFIDPRFSLPCRNTITHTVLPDIYQEAKEKLLDHVSLTLSVLQSKMLFIQIAILPVKNNDFSYS